METKLDVPVQAKFSEEVAEWIEAFDDLIVGEGPVQGAELIAALRQRAREGMELYTARHPAPPGSTLSTDQTTDQTTDHDAQPEDGD